MLCQELGGYAISNPDLRNAVRIVGWGVKGYNYLYSTYMYLTRSAKYKKHIKVLKPWGNNITFLMG